MKPAVCAAWSRRPYGHAVPSPTASWAALAFTVLGVETSTPSQPLSVGAPDPAREFRDLCRCVDRRWPAARQHDRMHAPLLGRAMDGVQAAAHIAPTGGRPRRDVPALLRPPWCWAS